MADEHPGFGRAGPRLGLASRDHPHGLRQPLPLSAATLGRRRRRHLGRTRQRIGQASSDADPISAIRPRHRLQSDVRHDRIPGRRDAVVRPRIRLGGVSHHARRSAQVCGIPGRGAANAELVGGNSAPLRVPRFGSASEHVAGLGGSGVPRDCAEESREQAGRATGQHQSATAAPGVQPDLSRPGQGLGAGGHERTGAGGEAGPNGPDGDRLLAANASDGGLGRRRGFAHRSDFAGRGHGDRQLAVAGLAGVGMVSAAPARLPRRLWRRRGWLARPPNRSARKSPIPSRSNVPGRWCWSGSGRTKTHFARP